MLTQIMVAKSQDVGKIYELLKFKIIYGNIKS